MEQGGRAYKLCFLVSSLAAVLYKCIYFHLAKLYYLDWYMLLNIFACITFVTVETINPKP